jgi:hypothetical protein
MSKEKYYIQVPHNRHRELSNEPLAVLRAEKSPQLELNTRASKLVAERWGINMQTSKAIRVVLSFEPGLMEIFVTKSIVLDPISTEEPPFECNMSIISDRKDQLKLCCAEFLRIPQIKYAFKYLALNGSDFGVVTTILDNVMIISLNPKDQMKMILGFNRAIAKPTDLKR